MSVVNGQLANQTTFNNAFMSRLEPNTSTVAIVKLQNAEVESGATVDNIQKALNKLFDSVGVAGENDVDATNYGSTNFISDGDTHKVAIEKLDIEALVQSDAIDALGARMDTAEFDIDTIEGRLDVIEGEDSSFGGNKTFTGNVIVQGDFEVNGTLTAINSVELEVTDATITVNKSGTDMSSEGAGVFVERPSGNAGIAFDSTLASKWKIGLIGSLYEVVVSGVAQAISGLKTFVNGIATDTIAERTAAAGVTIDSVLLKDGLVSGRDVAVLGTTSDDHETRIDTLETNNSEDVTIAAFGSTPDAKGASITGQEITLQPADATHPGGVSIGAQAFGGAKTFEEDVLLKKALNLTITTDNTTTGANVALACPTTSILRITNAGLTSIETIVAPSAAKDWVLINDTGVDVVMKDNTGTTAANRILTGLNGPYTLKSGASVRVVYDTTAQRSRLLGVDATASSGGSSFTKVFAINGPFENSSTPNLGMDGYFVFPFAAKITNVFMFQEVAGSGGTTELDIKVKPFGSGSFTSIFLTTPKMANTAGAEAWGGVGDTVTGLTAPVLSSAPYNVAAKTAMRCDLITKQTGSPDTCGLIVVYEPQ